MKNRKISAFICMLAWLIGSGILTTPGAIILNAQDLKDIKIIEPDSLSIQKYVRPDSAPAAGEPVKADSNGEGVKSSGGLAEDTIPVIERPDSLAAAPGLPKKKFIGTTQDIGIAFATLIGWLAFMWLAANQHE